MDSFTYSNAKYTIFSMLVKVKLHLRLDNHKKQYSKKKKKNASTFKLSTIISKETKCYNRTVVTSSKKERNIRTNMLKTLHPDNLSQEFNDV